jgi:hypothetical protein
LAWFSGLAIAPTIAVAPASATLRAVTAAAATSARSFASSLRAQCGLALADLPRPVRAQLDPHLAPQGQEIRQQSKPRTTATPNTTLGRDGLMDT